MHFTAFEVTTETDSCYRTKALMLID